MVRKKSVCCVAGPDGVKDHQTRVKDPQWVGHGTASPENTSNLNYLCRAPKVRGDTLPAACCRGRERPGGG